MNTHTNEIKLFNSNDGKLTLTNQRILLSTQKQFSNYTIEMFLKNISSIETKYNTYLFFLISAIIVLLYGLRMSNSGSAFIFSIIFSGILFAIWWFTRSHVISISSTGGTKLNIEIHGMKQSEIDDLIQMISAAQLNHI